jgi:hypothetical protein
MPDIDWQTRFLVCFTSLLVITFDGYRLVISEPPSSISGAYQSYDNVLHISQGDGEGAAGTIVLFLFVLNQLSYMPIDTICCRGCI